VTIKLSCLDQPRDQGPTPLSLKKPARPKYISPD
jgi:hypothetical protein